MNPVRLLSRSDVVKRLKPYKCSHVSTAGAVEFWMTGWGEPFSLRSENGSFDYWQIQEVVATVIAKTMPPEWNGPENGS